MFLSAKDTDLCTLTEFHSLSKWILWVCEPCTIVLYDFSVLPVSLVQTDNYSE